jgi:gamma-butyrobetaine dioxygenase
MSLIHNSVEIDRKNGGIRLSNGQDKSAELHPLWIRERVSGPSDFDAISRQRLYEHAEFSPDLKVTEIETCHADKIEVLFSDGYRSQIELGAVTQELGWSHNPETPPEPKSWDAKLNQRPEFDWHDLDTPECMKDMLMNYFTHGYCITQNTPTKRDSLKALARRFGYLRETNFGEIFNVETKPNPSDIAYTDAALASHTDNPYRDPVPGVQFLHCLRNEVSGGLSTLVDGMAIAERLYEESPDQAKVLEEVIVRFRYEGPSAILEHYGPLIERDHQGIIRHIRLSSRLDYVPALESETLSLFYAGRRRLHEMSNSNEFQISFPFQPGTLLMMDNYRLLHGRTAFNGKQGHRHLQGCYIDHDGPSSLYRMLARDGKTTKVVREDD